ncbi:hypothetical protein [Luteolibacter luteus]|uniref:Uncharacterized protein n=1 Tax=Luteolibacter luteus TaxID=2728835 RepID=A0A858RBU2_9BACT|nr:hypothetical protein [Luteolibacter luteus]QJE94237.1 hypothetical protein HHL09_00040 [Luteolibacter luteus]
MAEAKDHAQILTQDEEERHARKHSIPTRILGWMLIAGFILETTSSLFSQHLDLGGLLYFVAGIVILMGSQTALRFVAFCGILMMLLNLGQLIWSLAMDQPVKLKREWLDYRELRFWTAFVFPALFMFGESLLALVALRQRQLPYWTRMVKIFTAAFIVIFLAISLIRVTTDLRNKQLIHMFPKEVQLAENYLRTHGTMISSPATDGPQAEIKALPSLHSISFSEGGTRGWEWTSSASVPPDPIQRATHPVRLPSGKWGKIEFEFIARGDQP